MFEFNELEGFDWDDANRTKNWVSHSVDVIEAEEVFFNRPLMVQADILHSHNEERYFVLGQTNKGRYLFIAFTIREKKIRVISARDMSRKERNVYGKASA